MREGVISNDRRILLDIIRNPSRQKNVYRTFVLTSAFFLKCNNFLFSYIILYSSYIIMLYMLKHCFTVSFQVLCLLTQFKLCFVKCTHLKCSVFNSLKTCCTFKSGSLLLTMCLNLIQIYFKLTELNAFGNFV